MRKISAIILGFASFFCCNISAQYYDWGQEPASVKWQSMKTPGMRYIFPEDYKKQTVRLMHYMDTVRRYIGTGYTHGPLKSMPLIVHGRNFRSNGIVMLAPKRMEFIATPPAGSYATPWLKQLAAHEYRHSVQYNNLNRGLVRVLSYILGQQGSIIGLGLMPLWAMEGDAVLAETQMSTFGRGLQPSFSIEYRAMILEGTGDDFPTDKYFCGSYKDYMPDHYQLGYQIASWADTHYGKNIFDRSARYASRNPYLIFPFALSLRKHYGLSGGKLLKETFADLRRFWTSMPPTDDSSEIIPTQIKSYTVYSSPVDIGGGRLAAIKKDLASTERIVEVDMATGREHTLANIGAVNSGLSRSGDKLFWTEYRQSMLWEQRVNSVLCSYDLTTGKRSAHRDERRLMFAAAMPDGTAAGVEYSYDGSFALKHGEWRVGLPDTVSVHGLAYEARSGNLYFIGLSDTGMWIGAARPGEPGFRQVTRAGHTSIANLAAGEGVLYFNSIASGKDEAHMYDIGSGKEYRISDSRYGSFYPSASDGGVLMTTYTSSGYLLSKHSVDRNSLTEVPYSPVPQNTVNPPRRKWNTINLDDISVSDSTAVGTKKYRKGLNLFYFHSWAPVMFEAEEIISEGRFDIRAGATVISQNRLNSMTSQFSYGYDGGNSIISGKVNYYGLAPKFEVEATWSDARQLVYSPLPITPAERNNMARYFDITARAYLPMLLSSGYHYRRLTPQIEFEHNNALLYNYETEKYMTGLRKTTFSLSFSDHVRMAPRDFLPRWGYTVQAFYTTDPFNSAIGRIMSGYGRVYLPGAGRHHSLMLRGAMQHQKTSQYNYRQKILFPRGADFNFSPQRYNAVSADYQFPVWYPDGGIRSLVYFKRIRLNLWGDYARYKLPVHMSPAAKWNSLWSYGGDIIMDVVPLRLPSNAGTTITISIRKPSDRKGINIGLGFTMPI